MSNIVLDEEGRSMEHSFCFNASVSPPMWMTSKSIVFWVEGVSLGLTGVIGIIGNILTGVVLSKISLKNVFNQLILVLCAFDTLFNAFSVLEYSLKKAFGLISYSTPIYVILWPKFIYPLQNITYSASLCITMAIAIERYLAVCHPFFVHQEQSLGGNGTCISFRKRTLRYLLPALMFAVTINIPKFLEFRNFVRSDNETYIEPTEMRLDADYQFYYINWTRMTLTAFLPFVLLAFLNSRIIFEIRKAEKLSSQNLQGDSRVSTNRREAKLARILVLLVFSFLFCNLGKLLLNIYDIGSLAKIRTCTEMGLIFRSPQWVISLISVNHLLVVMNSSANLLLFSVIGTQFRATLLAILHLRPTPPRMHSKWISRVQSANDPEAKMEQSQL
ncbi:FMRFamide receptor-like isoform X2 [Tigriopus californicus]|uniref:FMRFamide receptor-like isoform X2 n=1 Tax=Tigriopus californicus TaxID=6832 RepID=UPI0027DA8617|nr:FMRFamide receptor-like isoform X2 [Tigriopus californicus]